MFYFCIGVMCNIPKEKENCRQEGVCMRISAFRASRIPKAGKWVTKKQKTEDQLGVSVDHFIHSHLNQKKSLGKAIKTRGKGICMSTKESKNPQMGQSLYIPVFPNPKTRSMCLVVFAWSS